MIHNVFTSLKVLFKPNQVRIDNNIFRLHYRLTTITLIAFAFLVTQQQYIGNPIHCMQSSKEIIPEKLLNTFCWIHTTFSIKEAWTEEVYEQVVYPGVRKVGKNETRVYHAYYQWVCFILLFQAILFYVPRYFWKSVEGGKLKIIILQLNSPILPDDVKEKNRGMLVDYLHTNLTHHNCLFVCYLIAELMNFVNVIGQMFLMNLFLGGHFLTYGLKVLSFEWEDDSGIRYNPMIQVFPRLTKCPFFKFGDSGDISRNDALCVLPINIINEKIYIFLWFWFIILAFLSGLVLLYRFLSIVVPRFSLMILKFRSSLANPDYLEIVMDHCGIGGDSMMINLLLKNMDPVNFRDLIADLARKLESKTTDISVL